MYKKAKILIFCTIFVASAAFCQQNTSSNAFFYTQANLQIPQKKYFKSIVQIKGSIKLKEKQVINMYPTYQAVISNDYYTCNFGFFCKKELQFEKATKIPLRFRLGSLQYNDWLEQKPNAINRY